MPFTDRLDYLCSMTNNFGYALAVEKLLGKKAVVPERAEYLRVIMSELTRISNHVWAIGFIPDIRRVFGYHGAEHKTINTYESGDELTVESVSRHSLVHPRCGTAFLLVVLVISIFVFSFLGRPPLLLRIASRIVLIPVIAGIAYEFIKFSAAHQDNWLMRLLIAPGLWLQDFTTRQPDAPIPLSQAHQQPDHYQSQKEIRQRRNLIEHTRNNCHR